MINWTLRNKFHWNFNRNSTFSLSKICLKCRLRNVVHFLSWPQCVNLGCCVWQCLSIDSLMPNTLTWHLESINRCPLRRANGALLYGRQITWSVWTKVYCVLILDVSLWPHLVPISTTHIPQLMYWKGLIILHGLFAIYICCRMTSQ